MLQLRLHHLRLRRPHLVSHQSLRLLFLVLLLLRLVYRDQILLLRHPLHHHLLQALQRRLQLLSRLRALVRHRDNMNALLREVLTNFGLMLIYQLAQSQASHRRAQYNILLYTASLANHLPHRLTVLNPVLLICPARCQPV